MKFVGSFVRAGAALVLLSACGAEPVTAAAAEASPSLMWRDLKAVRVQCLVQSTSALNVKDLETALCDRVRSLAAEGAPVPVERVSFGDPAMLAAGTVTLLFHGSVEPAGDRLALNFTIRPVRPSSPDSETYFGTAPRTAQLARGGRLGASAVPPLSSALAELLPWKLHQLGPVGPITEIH